MNDTSYSHPPLYISLSTHPPLYLSLSTHRSPLQSQCSDVGQSAAAARGFAFILRQLGETTTYHSRSQYTISIKKISAKSVLVGKDKCQVVVIYHLQCQVQTTFLWCHAIISLHVQVCAWILCVEQSFVWCPDTESTVGPWSLALSETQYLPQPLPQAQPRLYHSLWGWILWAQKHHLTLFACSRVSIYTVHVIHLCGLKVTLSSFINYFQGWPRCCFVTERQTVVILSVLWL